MPSKRSSRSKPSTFDLLVVIQMLDIPAFDPAAPKTLKDLVGNTEVWERVGASIASNTASHLVLVGPPGCGKTVFLRLALAGRHSLFIDCTANAGLRDVRDTVRHFARGMRATDGNMRWIVFERADALAGDTQAFLRRMMETTVTNTRMVFECRDAGAITEPILSRATIVSVAAPDETEIIYEIQHRTQFILNREVAEEIAKLSFGNLRRALIRALAVRWCKATTGWKEIQTLLTHRPSGSASPLEEWVAWAVETERVCRDEGLDLRDVLRLGWPAHPVVAQTCATWSRLGGTSSRTLFFDCVGKLAAGAVGRTT